MYFNTGVGWHFTLDGLACASRISGKDASHFVKSPVRRLQPNSWAEVKISGEKTLELKRDDVELKDKYRIGGRAEVEVLTSEGTFNFTIEISTEIDEFPF